MAAVGQVAEEGDPPVISGSQVAEEGGYVISKEGHRYLVGAGISGTYFFLPNKAIPKAKGELTMGQPIEGECTVVNETARTAVLPRTKLTWSTSIVIAPKNEPSRC